MKLMQVLRRFAEALSQVVADFPHMKFAVIDVNWLDAQNIRGADYAIDEHNAALVSDEMKTAVDAALTKIASGEMAVYDYSSDDSCPALTF